MNKEQSRLWQLSSSIDVRPEIGQWTYYLLRYLNEHGPDSFYSWDQAAPVLGKIDGYKWAQQQLDQCSSVAEYQERLYREIEKEQTALSLPPEEGEADLTWHRGRLEALKSVELLLLDEGLRCSQPQEASARQLLFSITA